MKRRMKTLTAMLATSAMVLVGPARRMPPISPPDGRYFYAAASRDNVMAKIDVAKMELVSTMPVPKASMFFAIKEGNSYPPTE